MPGWFAVMAQVPGQPMPALPQPIEAPRHFIDRGTLILLACLIALASISLFWAFFLRQRPKGPRGTLVVDGSRRSSQAYGSSGRRRRRKRRENHPENFGRNPTLSETGGLPPPRAEPPEPPPAAESSGSL
jgi:hypothetical protein